MIYSIPFDYLSKAHVKVTVNGREIDYAWITAYSVRLTTPPALGTKVVIHRETPHDELWVVWKDGSVMVADELNAQNMQTLFILQENMSRLAVVEKACENIPDIPVGQTGTPDYSAGCPVPFGAFYINDEGGLCLTVYGASVTEEICINDAGELVIRDLTGGKING